MGVMICMTARAEAPGPVQPARQATPVDLRLQEYDSTVGLGNLMRAVPVRTYTASGVYTAQLIVTDDDNATGTITITVTVDPAGSFLALLRYALASRGGV